MSAHRDYFTNWRSEVHECECGWEGKPKGMATELFEELLEHSCPDCARHLLLVSFPTLDEITAAAARADAEALEMLARIESDAR